MEIVRAHSGSLRARKTVAFDGAAGNGAVGTIDLFTITGVVFVEKIVARCSENLASGGAATVAGGGATDIDGFYPATTYSNLTAGRIWVANLGVDGMQSPIVSHAGTIATSQRDKIVNEDVIMTVATADVTNGTIVFDVWYERVSDDGLLVAA